MPKKKAMLVGLGNVGMSALDFLSRTTEIDRITVCDVDPGRGSRSTKLATFKAEMEGYHPYVEFRKLDLNDVEMVSQAINDFKPDVILNSTTRLSPYFLLGSPKGIFNEIYKAGFGPWLPVHLELTYKLMTAVRKAGVRTHVISACYPDAVNPVLGKLGMAPTVGTGNLDHNTNFVRKFVADKLKVDMSNVTVYIVGHHYTHFSYQVTGTRGDGPTYYFKILANDKDVTDEFDADMLMVESAKNWYSTLDSWARAMYVGTGLARNAVGILKDSGQLVNAPGPNGLVGGWPVRLSAKGVHIELPEDLSFEEAEKLNTCGQKCDGIERIEDNGTVVFTEKSTNIMKRILNYDHEKMKIGELEELANELTSKMSFLAALLQ